MFSATFGGNFIISGVYKHYSTRPKLCISASNIVFTWHDGETYYIPKDIIDGQEIKDYIANNGYNFYDLPQEIMDLRDTEDYKE